MKQIKTQCKPEMEKPECFGRDYKRRSLKCKACLEDKELCKDLKMHDASEAEQDQRQFDNEPNRWESQFS
jgi:hypothetical protein